MTCHCASTGPLGLHSLQSTCADRFLNDLPVDVTAFLDQKKNGVTALLQCVAAARGAGGENKLEWREKSPWRARKVRRSILARCC